MITMSEVMERHDEIMASLTPAQQAVMKIEAQARRCGYFNHKSMRENIEIIYRGRLEIAD